MSNGGSAIFTNWNYRADQSDVLFDRFDHHLRHAKPKRHVAMMRTTRLLGMNVLLVAPAPPTGSGWPCMSQGGGVGLQRGAAA